MLRLCLLQWKKGLVFEKSHELKLLSYRVALTHTQVRKNIYVEFNAHGPYAISSPNVTRK
jgi:hypothetical protein